MDPQEARVAELVLQVVAEGSMTTAYKLALLLALMDTCAANLDAHGRPPATIDSRRIAEAVAAYYTRQAATFVGPDGVEVDLRQINAKRADVMHHATLLRAICQKHGVVDLSGVVRHRLSPEDATAIDAALSSIERTFVRYPIERLQVVAGLRTDFLYSIRRGRSTAVLVLSPGAGNALVRLAPVLRPVVESRWSRKVADLNRLSTVEQHLQEHLFGGERRSMPRGAAAAMGSAQSGRCSYCARALPRPHLDHFVALSRYPNNSVENFVAADPTCNLSKSNLVAHPLFLEAWCERLTAWTSEFPRLASVLRTESDRRRSVSGARAAYANYPEGAPLWTPVGLVPMTSNLRRSAWSALAAA